MRIIIYSLSSSETPNDIRYIGKTKEDLIIRLKKHLLPHALRGKYHKNYWIKSEVEKGNKILINEIFVVPENDGWQKWEQHYIAKYKAEGYELTNSTIGGDGLHGRDNPFYGKHHSEKTKKLNQLNQPSRKEVYQYDLQGNLITKYDSIGEASRINNIAASSILDVCKHRPKYKTAGGYVWRFKGDSFSLDYINPAIKLRKKVYQFSLNGELLNVFDSTVEAAAKVNVSVSNISACCNNKLQTAGKFVWQYKPYFREPIKRQLWNPPKPNKKVTQYNNIGDIINEFISVMEAYRITGVNPTSISMCCNGKHKTAGGFIWKFA